MSRPKRSIDRQTAPLECIAVALLLLAGCQETGPEETSTLSNVVEHESDDAIESYLQAQDENSRQMEEQFQEQVIIAPETTAPPVETDMSEPPTDTSNLTVDII
ncbi:MAG: hypothetical protein ACF8AM_19290 [Rhodopirellula sp. JB055]|uniref:hypothetical protein n=1 Tax=Rhodopirellula sp. JB055 TaxID=3342846 RepID=UPI00370C8CE1